MPQKKKTIRELIIEYFKQHPNTDMPHGPIVDWVEPRYMAIHDGRRPRDIWRSVRGLADAGYLIKVKDGIHRYDPNKSALKSSKDFTKLMKEEILKKYDYKCAVCGRSRDDGTTLHIDHIRPRSRGGKSELKNGQVLCGKHNILKKNYGQYEFGKKMFLKLQKEAFNSSDQKMIDFCREILELYDRHQIDLDE